MVKLKIIFSVYGDFFDLDNFSKLIDICPTDSWLKGEPIKNPKFHRKETAWEYSTAEIETLDFEPVSEIIINSFDPLKRKILKFMTEWNLNCKIDIIVEMYNDDTPSLFFNRRFIDFASYLKAEIDVDMYIFKDDSL